MNKISRRTLIATGAATAALASTQLTRPKRSLAQGEVNLYSSRHYNTDDELYRNFERITGIRVNLIEAKADALLERIKNEGANSPADIFMTVDASRLWRAQKAGIFAPVPAGIPGLTPDKDALTVLQERIPRSLRHPRNLWFGVSKRARVIMYNKDRVNPADLSTYEDLANPKWRGKILIRSSSHVYNQSLVASLVASLGQEAVTDWTQGFVANFARPPQGNDRAQIEGAASGLGDIAIANTYYLPRYAKDKDPGKQAIFRKIGVFFPNQGDRGAHVNISGAGLVRTAPHQEAAIKFLEYLSSPVAQVFFAQANNEYPAVEGTPLDPVVAGFGQFKADDINVGRFGPNIPTAVQIMDRMSWA